MSNRKKIASIAFTGADAATVTMMGAAPAFALLPTRAASSYHGPIMARNKGPMMLVDTTKGNTLGCAKGVLSGANSKSIGSLPFKAGFFMKSVTRWSSCTGPFGLTFKAHLGAPANLWANTVISSKGDAVGATGVIGGPHKLSGSKVSIKISGTGLAAGCRATISGMSIPWRFNNAGHSFAFNSAHAVTLKVKSATAGCLGALAAGDNAYFDADDIVSVPVSLMN